MDASLPAPLDKLCGRDFHPSESPRLQSPLTPTEKSALKTAVAKQRLNLHRMEGHAKVLRKQVFSKHSTGRYHARVNVAGHTFGLPVKKKMPLAHRMAMYVELHELERKIVQQKSKVQELEKPLYGRAARGWNKAKQLVNNIFSEVRHYGAQGRGAAIGARASPFSPMPYISAALDTVATLYWAVNGVHTAHQVKNIKHLFNKGTIRLNTINEALKTLPSDSPDASALKTERSTLKKALKSLKDELDHKPLATNLENTTTSFIQSLDSYARILQAVAAIAPLLIKTGRGALGTLGVVAGVVTLPISVFLSCRGITSCVANLKQAYRDRCWASGVLTKDLSLLSQRSKNPADLLKLANLGSVPELQADITASAERINGFLRVIERFQREIQSGGKNPLLIAEYKRNTLNLVKAIDQEQKQLLNQVDTRLKDQNLRPVQRTVLMEARTLLNAKITAGDSIQTLNNTLLPFVRQASRDKIGLEALRAVAEGMMLASSVVMTVGLMISPIYGVSLPLLVTATVLGVGSLAIQYPVSMLVKKLVKMNRNHSHISRKTFNSDLANRLKVELANWDDLEKANLSQSTSAAAMFFLLKPYYSNRPTSWGPKEWAQALVDDPPNGKVWKEYYEAVNNMRLHDDSLGPSHRLYQWIAQRFKQHI